MTGIMGDAVGGVAPPQKRFVDDPNPWVPMTDVKDLRVIGKFVEELNECAEAAAVHFDDRQRWPGKARRSGDALSKEVADVLGNLYLVNEHFDLQLVEPNEQDLSGAPLLIELVARIGRAGAAAARCLIQGIDGREPSTGVINRQWLQDEIYVLRRLLLEVIDHFGLDRAAISARMEIKTAYLRRWHEMEGM